MIHIILLKAFVLSVIAFFIEVYIAKVTDIGEYSRFIDTLFAIVNVATVVVNFITAILTVIFWKV